MLFIFAVMTQQQLLDSAKQGDTQAISTLLNLVLQPKGISAKAAIKGNSLHLLLDAAEVPNQAAMVAALQPVITNLGITTVNTLMIYGRRSGEMQAAWSQSLNLPLESAAIASEPPVSPPLPIPVPISTGPVEPVLDLSLDSSDNEGELVKAPTSAAGTRPLPTPPAQASGNLKVVRNALLGALGLLVLGIVGLHTSVIAKQKQAIDQAQVLSASASSASNAPNINALRSSEQQLQEAINLLVSTPDIPGSSSRKVQEQLAATRTQLDEVQQRLKAEEQALANLQSAQKLRIEAAQIAKNQPPSLTTKQKAEQKLQEAVGLLTTIPQGTFVSPEAQERLATYQRNYAVTSEQVKGEQAQLVESNTTKRTRLPIQK
jgi:hypothetical protein